jgi:hypothetical protein
MQGQSMMVGDDEHVGFTIPSDNRPFLLEEQGEDDVQTGEGQKHRVPSIPWLTCGQ